MQEQEQEQETSPVGVGVTEAPTKVALSRNAQYNGESYRSIAIVTNTQD